jgi:DNA helicase II / ATP-dependent DNA helicase PcrA
MNEPTTEQHHIIEAARSTSSNLIVNALAGTGKTTTIEMICNAITTIPILYLAFNKRIVVEAEKRMPSHTECRTQNSLGHRVWAQATGRRLVVASDKMRTIVKAIIGELNRKDQGEAWEDYAETLKWLQWAKRDGLVPDSWTGPCERAVTWDDFCLMHEDQPSTQQTYIINTALRRSILAAYEGGIDYDDQIYMPVLFGGPWPKFPLVIIDEAQDWGPLGHRMLDKLVTKRLIAVGDPWQSIYAFKGAVCNGMSILRDRFEMEEYPLSVTWRVPKTGVLRANGRVSWYKAASTNPDGEVIHLDEWGPAQIPAEAAIICRNNAPLLSMGFKLLKAGMPIKMVGFDIGAGLVRILKKLGPPDMKEQSIRDAIRRWADAQFSSGKSPAGVEDRVDCLEILINNRNTLQEAIVHAEAIFKRDDIKPIQLLSGHKAKGLEWPDVIHLDPWRIPSKFAREGTEAWEQELNVKYVIETRFKQRLFLANLENFYA